MYIMLTTKLHETSWKVLFIFIQIYPVSEGYLRLRGEANIPSRFSGEGHFSREANVSNIYARADNDNPPGVAHNRNRY